MATGWSSTAEGHRELLIVVGFVLVNLLAPLCFEELFPFSRVALFPDAPDRSCDYVVHDATGQALPLVDFGLQRNYWGLRGFSVVHPQPHPGAIALPATVDRFGACASEAEVRTVVGASLRRLAHPRVEVTRQRIGQTGERVGVVEEVTWRISSPAVVP